MESLLKEIHPFNRLPRDQLSTILYLCKITHYRKGKYIYYQGDICNSIFFLVKGSVKLFNWDTREKEVQVKEEFPGSWLGVSEGTLNSAYFYDLRASSDSILVEIDKRYIPKLLNIEEVNRSISHSLSKWHLFYWEKSLKTSCLDELKEFIDSIGEKEIAITQEELALKLGYTRESINKNLKKLETDGEITLARGIITKKDS